ncbi:MAG: hypothetical protein PWR13_876 [Archaeoglobi archaeon]|nr:ribbon-helix-helix protein, CopG family [Candidatus Mnemosynella sp.]MBC7115379.1 ribbon-helix-helix protein, CopG family [Candidatus Mnemosynella bozhongmuii]MDI3502335.1 hypothetical protein [Archaeoglobi archaeon]MDK2781848.1 hypothetical protein [Archaeoglobi archaeon]
MRETRSFGVRIDRELADRIDEICERMRDLGTSRSEIIEVILKSFFSARVNHEQVLRGLITKKRLEMKD